MPYTEADTRAKLIDPRIKSSGWLESNIVREYYFTDGRKLVGGARGKQYYVDYLLVYENTNLAIIEAKAYIIRILPNEYQDAQKNIGHKILNLVKDN